MKTLFITYNGALEPLIKSQGIPYLQGIGKKGIGSAILSFEKPPIDRTAVASLKKQLLVNGIVWHWLKYHKRPSVPATLFDILAGVVTGLRLAIKNKADVIHSRATVAGLMGYLISRLTRKKFILDLRGLMAEEYADGGMWVREGILYKITSYIEKRLILKADAVVVLTENVKNLLNNENYLNAPVGSLDSKVSVIPCCVDTSRFRPFNKDDKKRIREKLGLFGKFVFLYTGSVGTWYMLDEMLDFFKIAKVKLQNAHFLFITHIDKELVRESCQKKDISPQEITIKGAAFEEMPNYLNAADCGIFFIKPVLSKRSSCPIKFAEYLACGLPVVINAGIGDTDGMVKGHDVGVVLEAFEQTEYLKAINRLLKLKEEGDELEKRCRRVAEEFLSLESGVFQYSEIYNRLNVKN